MGRARPDEEFDVVVVGSGPNGLAAAIALAQRGYRVLVIEGRDTVGGGVRSAELTLPGFVHDVCSAVHPLAVSSPFLRSLHLGEFGLDWVHPEVPLAHPLDGGRAVAHQRSVGETADGLGRDGGAWRGLVGWAARHAEALNRDLLGPLPLPPRHPLLLARFGATALWPAAALARCAFRSEEARALFGGHAAHSVLPLTRPGTAAFGVVLGSGVHSAGWPVARGGSGAIARALERCLVALGGAVRTGWPVGALDDLPRSRAVVFDTAPEVMASVCGDRLPPGYRRRLGRFRHGPGIFKVDFALAGLVPWAAGVCRSAGTVHVGGTFDEIAASERDCWLGRHSERPFVLVVQPTVCDPTRAPDGKQTLWAYCHVPHGCTEDRSEAITRQIERFAPGFRDLVTGRHTMNCADFERYNPNYLGGDITGGVQDLAQQWARPVLRWDPYSTPAEGIFICSSSTPPGAGVHGMGGFHAARSVARWLGRRPSGAPRIGGCP
jgi:phytoene dehydrogenase-like protein